MALAGLLADVGKRVLIVDLDPHGSMTSYFGYNPDNLERTGFELFQHGGQVPDGLAAQLLQKTSHPRIALLPASTALATLERQTPGKSGLGLVISKTLAQLWNDFDHVLIDSPPLLGVLMVNALAACQQLVVPVQTEFLAVQGLERMVHTLTMINRSRRQALPYLIVPTCSIAARRPRCRRSNCCATATRSTSGRLISPPTGGCAMPVAPVWCRRSSIPAVAA